MEVLATLLQMISDELLGLDTLLTDAAVKERKLRQVMHLLQESLQKSDAEVLDENAYTKLQQQLLSSYAAYELAHAFILGNSITASNAAIKRVKADVVEVEYAAAKDGSTNTINASALLQSLQQRSCMLAGMLQVSLPICNSTAESIAFVPFIIEPFANR